MLIILCGPKHCGKSYFGHLLAQRLHYHHLDLDRLIEDRYYREYNEKLSCREIYLAHGDLVFRSLEEKVLHSLVLKKKTILSLGGGTLLNPRNIQKISKIGFLICLELKKEILEQRSEEDPPAYLDKENLKESFEKAYKEREKAHELLGATKLCLNGKTDEEVIASLEKLIHAREDTKNYG